ncbi:hypothetical protein GTI80_16525, partial [Enterococcus faecalis]|nr:hypothetical protein [Enterococcus faecalis]
AGKTNEDTRINVPIDDNFNTVLKRIRSGENGIFERFRDNLLIEIVSYWNDQRLKNDEPTAQTVATPVTEETVSVPEEKVEEPKADTTENTRSTDTNAALSFADFSKAVAEYPKFYTEQNEQEVVIYEKNADEPRKLATISMTAENE